MQSLGNVSYPSTIVSYSSGHFRSSSSNNNCANRSYHAVRLTACISCVDAVDFGMPIETNGDGDSCQHTHECKTKASVLLKMDAIDI